MHTFLKLALVSLVPFISWTGSASAAETSFTLTPPICSGVCGASRLSMQKLRPAYPILSETQNTTFNLHATDLLRNSGEHLAVALMASDQPFLTNGAWNSPSAPGGGLGIALGKISSEYHPACPVDPNDTRVEFAIERFVASGVVGSTLVSCVSFPKALLAGAPVLRISINVMCSATAKCWVTATLRNAGSNTVIASVGAGADRANMVNARRSWYAVTDFDQADGKRYSARFENLEESYFAEPKGGPLP